VKLRVEEAGRTGASDIENGCAELWTGYPRHEEKLFWLIDHPGSNLSLSNQAGA